MKTIKEGAEIYYQSNEYQKSNSLNRFDNIFKAGVEFAQRWISVEDELPKHEGVDFYVLMKNDSLGTNEVTIGLIEGIDDIENVYQYSTHWRPIELK